jgi:SAM-dependent methyltransferase
LITNIGLCLDSITLSDINITPKLKRYKAIEGNIEEVVCNLDQKFDLIVFNQVLEHLSNPDLFIKNCYSLLNTGGILYLETPNINGYDAKLTLNNGCWGGFHAPRHFTIFSALSASNLLKSNRFYVVASGYLLSPFLMNETIKNIFDSKGWIRYKKYLTLSNPIILGIYLMLDILALVLKVPTGNMFFIARK